MQACKWALLVSTTIYGPDHFLMLTVAYIWSYPGVGQKQFDGCLISATHRILEGVPSLRGLADNGLFADWLLANSGCLHIKCAVVLKETSIM